MNRPIFIACTILFAIFFAFTCVAEENHQTIYKSKYTVKTDIEQTLGCLNVQGDKSIANLDGTFAEEYKNKIIGEYIIKMKGRRGGLKYWKIECLQDGVYYRINKFTINEEGGGGYRDKEEYTGVWNISITAPAGRHTLKSWQNADVDMSALLHIDSYEINYDMTMERAAAYACKNFYKIK